MFEVGFSELIMVGLVALLVVGPERLPQLARIAGFWIGKARRTSAAIKAEIREELALEASRHPRTSMLDDDKAVGEEIDTALSAISSANAPGTGGRYDSQQANDT